MWDVCQAAVFEEWWAQLSEQEQDDVTASCGSSPTATPCGSSYAFDPTRSAILLIGGNKTGQEKRFYKTMIPKADALYDAHLKTLQAHPSHDPPLL